MRDWPADGAKYRHGDLIIANCISVALSRVACVILASSVLISLRLNCTAFFHPTVPIEETMGVLARAPPPGLNLPNRIVGGWC